MKGIRRLCGKNGIRFNSKRLLLYEGSTDAGAENSEFRNGYELGKMLLQDEMPAGCSVRHQ